MVARAPGETSGMICSRTSPAMTELLVDLVAASMRGGLATLVRATEEDGGAEEGEGRLSLIFCGEDCEAGWDARSEGCAGALVAAGADFGAEWELIFVCAAAGMVLAAGSCGSTETAC